ncbi:hypothetical protein H7J51_03335 [Mycobacterium crocinum]|uniref:PPE family protein n=1 Tax=Mycolicibacterium crocinum TaxID=388459 RepID=A0ABY3TEK5_9MYCO|nr:hypothetical protein [Mycolicibacterium crocinum]MCV7214318.1 hypothetical protein [Mycolicibacterium crocinum]ULN39823.1 hypothetical protein MI149_19135 [Mycolicibacterium crocinum]
MSELVEASAGKRACRALVAVLASGALWSAAVNSSGQASATCASVFGLGNSADCRSGFGSIATAVGSGATAFADGLFSTAIALGTNAVSYTDPNGLLQTAIAMGPSADAEAYGVLALAIQAGTNGAARAENGIANVAVNLSPSTSFTLAKGSLNLAMNLFGRQAAGGSNITSALGTGNVALNLGGENDVAAGEYAPDVPARGSFAFSLFGTGNTVAAVPGPFALAGSVGQSGATVTKSGPGFNINGIRAFGAAGGSSGATAAGVVPAVRGTGHAKPPRAVKTSAHAAPARGRSGR